MTDWWWSRDETTQWSGDSCCLGPATRARPVSTRMHPDFILASVFEIFPAQIKYIKERYASLTSSHSPCVSPHTHTHTYPLVFCIHISIWRSSFPSETIDSFRFFCVPAPSLSLSLSLTPHHLHPHSFSKVFLFRETMAPWDIVVQAARQTEQVFFVFFLLSSTFYWMSEVPRHRSSQRLSASAGWWRGVGGWGCVCGSLSLLCFSGPFVELCLSDRRAVPWPTSWAKKLQIDSHHSGKRGLAGWRNGCAYCREAYCVFCAFSLSFSPRWLKLLFFLIPFKIHTLCPYPHTVVRTLLTSSLESRCPSHTRASMRAFNAHTLILFRLYPCSLSCSSAEHSSTLIKAAYLRRSSPFPSHAA